MSVSRNRRALHLAAAFLSMIITAPLATAGEASGTIEFIQAGHGYTPENAYVLVKIAGTRIGQPACATDPRLALNPATAAGKAILALLLTAKAAGTSVALVGTGSCTVMGTEFESISYLRAL